MLLRRSSEKIKSELNIRNSDFLNVARPGFEPRQTVPKTVVLPLYYRAIHFKNILVETDANIAGYTISCKSIFKIVYSGLIKRLGALNSVKAISILGLILIKSLFSEQYS